MRYLRLTIPGNGRLGDRLRLVCRVCWRRLRRHWHLLLWHRRLLERLRRHRWIRRLLWHKGCRRDRRLRLGLKCLRIRRNRHLRHWRNHTGRHVACRLGECRLRLYGVQRLLRRGILCSLLRQDIRVYRIHRLRLYRLRRRGLPGCLLLKHIPVVRRRNIRLRHVLVECVLIVLLRRIRLRRCRIRLNRDVSNGRLSGKPGIVIVLPIALTGRFGSHRHPAVMTTLIVLDMFVIKPRHRHPLHSLAFIGSCAILTVFGSTTTCPS
ncbi:hypothetical protein BTHE_1954 [Bifidobacterium thermophilum]|nr:hypothetical protein BTHE_1954 [Bifidobacterium thermophilum]